MSKQDPDKQSSSKENKPQRAAYGVVKTPQGKSYFNHVGSVKDHRDGRGETVYLHSTPVNGEIVIRELREQAHQHFDQQQQEVDQEQQQSHERNSTHDQSR